MSREIAKLYLPLFEILNPLASSLRTHAFAGTTMSPGLSEAKSRDSLTFVRRALRNSEATPADQLSSLLQTQNLDLNCSRFQSSILVKFNRWIELIRG